MLICKTDHATAHCRWRKVILSRETFHGFSKEDSKDVTSSVRQSQSSAIRNVCPAAEPGRFSPGSLRLKRLAGNECLNEFTDGEVFAPDTLDHGAGQVRARVR